MTAASRLYDAFTPEICVLFPSQTPQPSERAWAIQFDAVEVSRFAESPESVKTAGAASLIVFFGDEQHINKVLPQPLLARICQLEHMSCPAGVAVKQHYPESPISDGVELGPELARIELEAASAGQAEGFCHSLDNLGIRGSRALSELKHQYIGDLPRREHLVPEDRCPFDALPTTGLSLHPAQRTMPVKGARQIDAALTVWFSLDLGKPAACADRKAGEARTPLRIHGPIPGVVNQQLPALLVACHQPTHARKVCPHLVPVV